MMLKVKQKRNEPPHKKKIAAYKEIQKEDKTKAIHAKIPAALHKKLRKKLVDEQKTFTDWVIEEIEKM